MAAVYQGNVRFDAMNVRKSAPKSGDLGGISVERNNGVITEEFARNGEPDPGCTARDDNNLIFHMHLSKNDLGNEFTMHPASTWSPALNLPDFGTDGSDGSHDLVAGNEWVVHAPTRFSPRGYPNGRRHNTGYRSQCRERRVTALGGLRYGAIESALRPPLPTATPSLRDNPTLLLSIGTQKEPPIGVQKGPLSWRIGNDRAESGRCAGQSRPKPRGGTIAWSSVRSRSQIACNASAVALSCRFSGRASSQAA